MATAGPVPSENPQTTIRFALVLCGRETIGSLGVEQQALLARHTGRSAVAAVRQRNQSRSICGHRAKARHASGQEIAVAMEEQNDGTVALGRHVPDDDLLAVRRVEDMLLRRRKLRRGGRGALGLARIEKITLHEIQQRDRSGIAENDDRNEPFQSSACSNTHAQNLRLGQSFQAAFDGFVNILEKLVECFALCRYSRE